VDEIDRENAAGLDGQELLPGRAAAAGCGVDPRGMPLGVDQLIGRAAGSRLRGAGAAELQQHVCVPG